MTRDYKNVRYQDRSTNSAWLWFAGGLSIGLMFTAGLYFYQPHHQSSQSIITQPSMITQASDELVKPEEKSKPRFDFYTLLPQLEVGVSTDEPDMPERPSSTLPLVATATTPTVTAPGIVKPDIERPMAVVQDKVPTALDIRYLLQAGSFRRHNEADTLKAQLALLGIEADVKTVMVKTGTWHRVQVGPYATLAQVNDMRQHLRENNIDTVVLKTY